MKIILIPLLFTVMLCHLFGQSNEKEDQTIKLDGKITISEESDSWLKITVPFLIVKHPDLKKMDGKRPESIEEMFNPEFLDNLKISIWVSFMNEFNRKELGGDRKDVRFFNYYHAEIECLALEIDRRTKKAEFLFPSIIAKMNEMGSYPKIMGYVTEFSRNGENFPVSDQIKFLNYDKKEYVDRFRDMALNDASEVNTVLIPGYFINDSYLNNLGPVVR